MPDDFIPTLKLWNAAGELLAAQPFEVTWREGLGYLPGNQVTVVNHGAPYRIAKIRITLGDMLSANVNVAGLPVDLRTGDSLTLSFEDEALRFATDEDEDE